MIALDITAFHSPAMANSFVDGRIAIWDLSSIGAEQSPEDADDRNVSSRVGILKALKYLVAKLTARIRITERRTYKKCVRNSYNMFYAHAHCIIFSEVATIRFFWIRLFMQRRKSGQRVIAAQGDS